MPFDPEASAKRIERVDASPSTSPPPNQKIRKGTWSRASMKPAGEMTLFGRSSAALDGESKY